MARDSEKHRSARKKETGTLKRSRIIREIETGTDRDRQRQAETQGQLKEEEGERDKHSERWRQG